MAQSGQARGAQRLNGQVIVSELLRNMELGAFEMAYTTLLPCVFHVYLHPEDHNRLAGVFELIAEDAKRALGARVAELNAGPRSLSLRRRPRKEHRIAARDWTIQFFADTEDTVPPGDIEIHSELSEAPQPGFQGVRTTLIDREPSVTAVHNPARAPAAERIYAEIRYEDDSGSQVFLVTQNEVRIGRGGDEEPMDLALYTNDEVSREHALVRRDAATGRFFIVDKSTNGTWLNGRRLKRELAQELPDSAEIGVAEVLTLNFQVRR
ncbi:MAG TPA: FHA domain-containing protein [Bryobacteraceae bacterium]|nr:FHA domain-containing protein [Bryobacteraceae bacterium]